MIHFFNTKDKNQADAALLLYSVYRSRTQRFKIDTDMWDKIARFTKSSAQASRSIPAFLQRFSEKMECDSIKPNLSASVGKQALVKTDNGSLVSVSVEREFLTDSINDMSDVEVISALKNETVFIILLVRERLEQEKATREIK